jgi:ring-1,2-phenylacetyl-CoA epoxidase subunit PaaA
MAEWHTQDGEVFSGNVPDVAALSEMPEEYRQAVAKIVRSHAINELTGAETFDEPAIRLAPTPRLKWLVSRATMEEYGHHVLFARLAEAMGVEWKSKKPLTLFDYPLKTWVEYGVLKAIGDLAEIIQLEDLENSTFYPLRRLAVKTMPEERFHVGLGEEILRELLKDPANKSAVEEALERMFPAGLAFFGSAQSENSRKFVRWGLKRRSNEAMRQEYVRRVGELCRKFGLKPPTIPDQYQQEGLAFAS